MKCTVCACESFKVLSKEKHCIVTKCRDCGKEYQQVTATQREEVRREVEGKIKRGEMDFKDRRR